MNSDKFTFVIVNIFLTQKSQLQKEFCALHMAKELSVSVYKKWYKRRCCDRPRSNCPKDIDGNLQVLLENSAITTQEFAEMLGEPVVTADYKPQA